MSSHSYSVSGQRPINMQLNGGAVTGVTCPSKKSDAIEFRASGFDKIEIPLHQNIHIEKRKVTRRGSDEPYEVAVLVIGDGPGVGIASLSLFGHPADTTDSDSPGGENTQFDARRPGEKFGATAWYDDVELVETYELTDQGGNLVGVLPVIDAEPGEGAVALDVGPCTVA